MRRLFLTIALFHLLSIALVAQGVIDAEVWDDRNGNSRKDSGEPGINGVKVELYSSTGTLEQSAPTTLGMVRFSGLADGAYYLKFIAPEGHALTTQTAQAASEDHWSDAQKEDGKTSFFSVSSGDTIRYVDAGMWTPGTVVAEVWEDRSFNGRKSRGEPGIKGVVVELLDASAGDSVLASKMTDASGSAHFLGMVPADRPIRLRFVEPEGYRFTPLPDMPTAYDKWSDAKIADDDEHGKTEIYTISKGNELICNLDAGLFLPATIETKVWNDKDGDGIQDDLNAALEQIKVELWDETNRGSILRTSYTDSNGVATFSEIPANRDFRLKYYPPNGFIFTKQDASPNDALDSDVGNNAFTEVFRAKYGGEVVDNFDAGLFLISEEPGEIQARVWDDKNGNGIQDEGDVNVSGIRVDLLDPSNGNSLIAMANTDESGLAIFEDVSVFQKFRLKFYLPEGYGTTLPNIGGDESLDSDAGKDGLSQEFIVGAGETFDLMDLGVFSPGTIYSRVWNDRDGDGIQDDNNADMPDIKVVLLDLDNNATPLDTAYTDSSGIATFLNVPADRNLRMKYFVPEGYEFSLRDKGSDDLVDNDVGSSTQTDTFWITRGCEIIERFDAGILPFVPKGNFQARVWDDKDGNGLQDDIDANVSGIKVELLDVGLGNAVIETAITDESGVANFLDVPANKDVRLRFTVPAYHAFTLPNVGGNDAADSDADENGLTEVFNTGQNESPLDSWDAGIWLPGTIEAQVWSDNNGNGKQDDPDSDLEGVKVELLDVSQGGAVLATTNSDENGIAAFDNVPADRELQMRFYLPEERTFTRENVGRSDEIDSDVDVISGLTDTIRADRGSQLFNSYDAGVLPQGALQVRIWNDINGDGIQQKIVEVDQNVEGVTVQLLDPGNGDAVMGEATSDENGIATLFDVPSDQEVRLKFSLPQNSLFTLQDIGEDDARDSDVDENGLTETFFTQQGGETFVTWDAGVWLPGTIEARVWNDKNSDGTQDDLDANVSGVKVDLLDASNGDALVASVLTDENGIASFLNVPADKEFRLKFYSPANFAFTAKDVTIGDVRDSDADVNGLTEKFSATRGSQLHDTWDAGLLVAGGIEARVWNDKNGDGKQDDIDADVSGIKVELLDVGNGNAVIGTAFTNDNGIASIADVPVSREVRLKFYLPEFYAFTLQDVGERDDSDVDENGLTATFVAENGGQLFTEWDAGMWLPGTIITRVWNDKDGDGKQDDADSDLSGVLVELLDASNGGAVLKSATTNEEGLATIEEVPADRDLQLRYSNLPAGSSFTLKDQGNRSDADVRDSDADGAGLTPIFRATQGSQLYLSIDAGIVSNPGITDSRSNQPLGQTNGISVSDFSMFPVPAIDEMNVFLKTEFSGIGVYRIFDASGRIVQEGQIPIFNGSNQFQLKLNEVQSGNYILRLQVGEELISRQFLIQNR